MKKRCIICSQVFSLDNFRLVKNKWYGHTCRKCECKKELQRRRKRALKRKVKAITILGGKCKKCGYNKNLWALDFNHINPKQKRFEMSRLIEQRPWKVIRKELKKCELLCANCHREYTSEVYYKGIL